MPVWPSLECIWSGLGKLLKAPILGYPKPCRGRLLRFPAYFSRNECPSKPSAMIDSVIVFVLCYTLVDIVLRNSSFHSPTQSASSPPLCSLTCPSPTTRRRWWSCVSLQSTLIQPLRSKVYSPIFQVVKLVSKWNFRKRVLPSRATPRHVSIDE